MPVVMDNCCECEASGPQVRIRSAYVDVEGIAELGIPFVAVAEWNNITEGWAFQDKTTFEPGDVVRAIEAIGGISAPGYKLVLWECLNETTGQPYDDPGNWRLLPTDRLWSPAVGDNQLAFVALAQTAATFEDGAFVGVPDPIPAGFLVKQDGDIYMATEEVDAASTVSPWESSFSLYYETESEEFFPRFRSPWWPVNFLVRKLFCPGPTNTIYQKVRCYTEVEMVWSAAGTGVPNPDAPLPAVDGLASEIEITLYGPTHNDTPPEKTLACSAMPWYIDGGGDSPMDWVRYQRLNPFPELWGVTGAHLQAYTFSKTRHEFVYDVHWTAMCYDEEIEAWRPYGAVYRVTTGMELSSPVDFTGVGPIMGDADWGAWFDATTITANGARYNGSDSTLVAGETRTLAQMKNSGAIRLTENALAQCTDGYGLMETPGERVDGSYQDTLDADAACAP